MSQAKRVDPVKRILRRLKSRLDGPPFRPDPAKHSFLASFPRSGNTWMRTVLFHYIYDRPPENFSELHLGVPDEHMRVPARNVYVGREAYPHARIVKTHNPYQISRKYENVVYIVRDPRDVLPSYWKYMCRQSKGFDLSFEAFLSASVNGAIWPCSWHEHVASWKNVGATRVPNFAIVRYEDLKEGCPQASAKMALGLGLGDTQRMHDLVAHYDFDRMQQLEATNKKRDSIDKTQPGFIGKGAASSDMRQRVEDSIFRDSAGWESLMNSHGYISK